MSRSPHPRLRRWRPSPLFSSACSDLPSEATDKLASRKMRKHFSRITAAETEAVAGRLARKLQAGDVVTVSGELGSGKTTFVRGACRALEIEVPVTSPTFT